MKKIEKKVYTVRELPADILAEVLENHRYWNVEFSEWDKWILENWKDKLKEYGFFNTEISYSGFWSQGDGASFTSTEVDLPLIFENNPELKEECKTIYKLMQNYDDLEVWAEVKRRSSMYSHSYTVYVNLDYSLNYGYEERGGYQYTENNTPSSVTELVYAIYDRELEKESVILEEFLTGLVRELSGDIYADLENTYYSDISDESVLESLEANEVLFYEDGSIA